MRESQIEIVAALQRVIAALNRLTEEEIKKLLDESYEVEIRLVRRRQKDDVAPNSMEMIDLQTLVLKLTAFGNREEATEFLAATFETKKPLEQIARFLDIPIIKQDKVETLREKIIEATAGARLRSEAIKGKV